MPERSFDELFGTSPDTKRNTKSFDQLFGGGKEAKAEREAATRASEASTSVPFLERSLAAAGFENVPVEEGIRGSAAESLQANREGLNQELEEDEQLKQLASQANQLGEFRQSVEAIRGIPEGRSLLDIRTDQLESTPAVLRPFVVGAAQTALRSASLVARGFSLVGFDTDEVADDLSREAGDISHAQVQAGAGEVEQAATSAVSSLMQVLQAGGVGLGTKGIAVAFGVGATNEAITEGRDAGLEGVELARFATTQGVIEGAGTLIFNKLLGPGVEKLGQIGKKEFTELLKKGTGGILKKFAMTSLSELPEELSIELLQSINTQLAGVDPNALTPENLLKVVRQTTMATFMTAGASAGLETVATRAAERIQEKEGAQTPDETVTPTTSSENVGTKPEIIDTKEDSLLVTKRRLRELKAEGRTDELTGLGNRRMDNRAVETLFKRADREGKAISLVSFDIANFKSLNDTLGLEAGDKALQIIANSIQAEIRGGDKARQQDVAGIATRPGGDEFNVFLPNTPTEGAQAVADRISKRVDAALKEEGIQLPKEGRPVFAAPGVVTRTPNDSRSIEDLRKEADFAVKARKKAVKTELGVPLTREEASLTETPSSLTSPAVQEAPGAVAPVTTEAVTEAPKATTTPSKARQVIDAAPKTITPSQAKKLAAGEDISVRKRTRKPTVAQELKTERQGLEGGQKAKFSPEGFRSVRPFADRQISDLKSRFSSTDTPSREDISNLLSVARTVLPPQERGKLIPGVAKIRTKRDALSQLGRIEKAVETFGHKLEAGRLKEEQSKLKKLGRKIPVPLRELITDEEIAKLKALDGGKLTAEEAANSANQIAFIRGMVKELNDLKLGTEKKGAIELEAELIKEMTISAPKIREETGKVNIVNEFVHEQNTKPEELLEAMGSQHEQALHRSLKEGEEVTMRINQDFSENFANKFDMRKLAKWSRSAGKKVKKAGFTLDSGREVTLTYMELANMIAISKTQANKSAVLKDGFTLSRKKHENRIKVTRKDLKLFASTAKKLDPDIIRFAGEVKRYLNEDLKPQYDTAFQALNNYSNIIDDYLPILRNAAEFFRVPTSFDFKKLTNFTLDQIRETKERSGSGASILVDGLDVVIDNHVNRVGLYIGQARPMRNANIILNMPGVSKAMDSRFGTQRRAFLNERMDHAVQSAVRYNSSSLGFTRRLTSKLVSNATRGVLGINPFVAAKQLSSFATAMTQMPANFVFRGAKLGLSRKVEERMMSNSPQAWTRYNTSRIRLVGQFEDKQGTIFDRNKFSEKIMGMISFMDKAVIRTIWRGAEIEIAETTDLKVGSPKYYTAVNKRFNQVVDRTQPAFSVLDQAGMALEGRTNSLAKLAGAMFMSQRNQNFTMIRRAARQGGPKMWRDLGIVMAVAPVSIALIDAVRTAAYGYDEDKETGEKLTEILFDTVESNLSVIYGSQVVLEAFQIFKRTVQGETGSLRRRENVVSASVSRIQRGVSDLADALLAAGKKIESGPARGRSQARKKLISAVENLSVGVGTLTGVPLSTPVQVVKAFGRQIWTDDYGVLFRERTKLRKLDKDKKLSDFQREKLQVLEEAFSLTNIAQRAATDGLLERADADQYISDRMRSAIQIIEQLEDNVVKSTFTEKEKPKEDEVFLRKFYAEHGEALFKLQVQHKEATLAESQFKKIVKSDQRRFLKENPEALEKIRSAKRSRKALSLLTRIRKKLGNPDLDPGQRASLNGRVKEILKVGND